MEGTKGFTQHDFLGRSKNKNHAGFTLIELVVVMTLIAVLTVLSGGFLKDLYDNYKAAQAAEEVLGLIRDAQSKSMASEGAKAYGIEIFAKGATDPLPSPINKLTYMLSGDTLAVAAADKSPVGLDVDSIQLDKTKIVNCGPSGKCNTDETANKFDSESTKKSFVFNFTSPFGMPEYFLRTTGASDGTDNYCNATSPSPHPSVDFKKDQTATICGWLQNSNYLKNYSVFHVGSRPTDTAIAGSIQSDGGYTQNSGSAKITLKYNNVTRSVIVKGTGEAYIE